MGFAKGSKGENRKDKKKAVEKAQIYEELEGQDLDSVQSEFQDALDVSFNEAMWLGWPCLAEL